MPRNDKTGPMGLGPLTGRRLGVCVGNEDTVSGSSAWFGRGFGGRGFGRGFGGGRGRGFGRGYGFGAGMGVAPLSDEKVLKSEIDILKEQLSLLEKRLSDQKKD
ncbi:MAG: DUF5320 domain-containing protein [Bacteroidales bacterium]|nr:DUF5320 domain-containing protein [Bacteroidales bacterium]